MGTHHLATLLVVMEASGSLGGISVWNRDIIVPTKLKVVCEIITKHWYSEKAYTTFVMKKRFSDGG